MWLPGFLLSPHLCKPLLWSPAQGKGCNTKDNEEDGELPNSHVIVEANLDEIPLTSGFNSEMPQVENVESPNSHVIVAINLNDFLKNLGVNVIVHYSFTVEVGPFHVIFYMNGDLIATCFNKGSHNTILCFGLKELLEKCLVQFVYIWFIA